MTVCKLLLFNNLTSKNYGTEVQGLRPHHTPLITLRNKVQLLAISPTHALSFYKVVRLSTLMSL